MESPAPQRWTESVNAPPRGKAKWIALEDLREPQPRAALAYWLAKRGERLMPHPKDISPAEIPKLLPYISLVDFVAGSPPDYFYRIEGDAVRTAIGFNRMGHHFSDFRDYLGPVYPRAVDRLQCAFASSIPLAQTSMLSGLGRSFYTIEIVFLPFSLEGNKVDRIMMCMGILQRPDHRFSAGDLFRT